MSTSTLLAAALVSRLLAGSSTPVEVDLEASPMSTEICAGWGSTMDAPKGGAAGGDEYLSLVPPLVPLVDSSSSNADELSPRTSLPPPLKTASEAVRTDRPHEALAALEGTDERTLSTPPGRLLMAEALRLAGRCGEAVPIYENLLLSSMLLSDLVRFNLARCLTNVGRPRDAAAVLRGFTRDSPLYLDAGLARADALLRSKEAGRAKSTLIGLFPPDAVGSRAGEANLLLGKAHKELGDLERAATHLRAAVLKSPDSPYAERAAEEMPGILAQASHGIAAGSPFFESPPPPAPSLATAWRALAHALGDGGARRRLARLEESRFLKPLGPTILAARATMSASLGQHAEAIELLDRAAGVSSRCIALERLTGMDIGGPLMRDPDLVARASFAAGASAKALGRNREARRRFEMVARRHPEHPLSRPARLEAAGLAIRTRDYEGSSANLEGLLLLDPDSRDRPRALFLLGWSFLRSGEIARAADLFSVAALESAQEAALERRYGGASIASAARTHYWAARSMAMVGDLEDAKRAWMRVVSDYPLSYYAGMAERRIASIAGVVQPVPIRRHPSEDAPMSIRVQRARGKLELGWIDEARRELLPLMMRPQSFDGRSLASAADLMNDMGRIASARALYRSAALQGGRDLSPARLEQARRFAFPKRYSTIIEREAQRWRLSPWLLYGLVLRESGFAPCATSRVGALGLAQLMMPTARESAADLGLPPPTKSRLCEPDYNLRLGAWHLRKLLRYYDGNEILAVAAYNAGQGSVDRWLARSGDTSMDIFVEEIPFEETRAYVRMVLSAKRAYRLTWGETSEIRMSGLGASPGPQEHGYLQDATATAAR